MENLNRKNRDFSDKKSYDVLTYLKNWQNKEGQNKYKCDARRCGKFFITNEILKSHMTIHKQRHNICYIL